MKYLNKITSRLKSNKVELTGSSVEQILNLEKKTGKNLPLCYKEFLEQMGRYTNLDNQEYQKYNYSYVGFGGESMFYADVTGDYTNKDALIEQLEEDGRDDLQLTDNDFVFYCHQGYIFAFFKLDEGDNPPVYGYKEGYKGDSFPKLTDTLVEFYEKYLEYGQSPFGNLNK